jgi:hypothetical protein
VRLAISWSVTCAMIFDAESRYNTILWPKALRFGATETSDRNKTRPRIFPVELGRYDTYPISIGSYFDGKQRD